MNCKDKMEKFYSSLTEISQDIEKSIVVVSKNIDRIGELINNFNENIQNITIEEKNFSNEELLELLKSTLQTIQFNVNNWYKLFEETKKGEQFINELKNYFIIMVFGKVKAGKSSVGNFIAQQYNKDKKVEFFVYDNAGEKKAINKLEEIEDNYFEVDNLECTSSIQGFKLEGMVWIDTPGLGSMTKENGELAKKYIKYADYIVYLTSSDSPMQKDELEELEELFKMNKKVSIFITKSDKFIRKKDENGKFIRKDGKIAKFLVNKLIEDRKKQEEYVTNEVLKICNDSLIGDVISISTHVAKQALNENNLELLEGSNVCKMYDIFLNVLQNKAVELKKETPLNVIKNFASNILVGITEIEESLSQLENKIEKIQKNLEKEKELLIYEIERELENLIQKYYFEININNSAQIFEKIKTQTDEIAKNLMQKNLENMFNEIDKSLINLNTLLKGEDFKIKDRYEDIVVTTKTIKRKIGSTLGGLIAGVGTAFLTGGASLIVSAGAVIGASYLGSKAGEKIGESLGDNQHIETIKVGDNKDEIIEKFKNNYISNMKSQLDDNFKNLTNEFLVPMDRIVKEIKNNLLNLKKELKKVENVL